MYGCHEPYLRSLHIISQFPILLGFFLVVDTHCHCCDSDCVQLFILVSHYTVHLWPRELHKSPWSWRRRRLLHSSETLLVERVERLNSFKNRREGLQRNLSLTIFIANLLFFAKALHLRKSFSLLFITDLNTASLVERSQTTAISYISSASVMLECGQNLSKLTNQRVYQSLVYGNDQSALTFY